MSGVTSVTLPEELHGALAQLGLNTGRTVQELVEKACRTLLSRAACTQQQQQQQQQDADAANASSDALLPLLCSQESVPSLYINQPILTIVDGLLHGEQTVRQALRHGNFGLGTLDYLDGEVVVLDGKAYQQDETGSSRPLDGSQVSPFISLCAFDERIAVQAQLPAAADLEALLTAVKEQLRSENLIYAVRIRGHFPYVKTRAVRKQRGNRRLADVAKEQAPFKFHDEEGSLIGFWYPPWAGSALNVPGFHLHLLSADLLRGGHVLQCSLAPGGELWLQEIHRTKVDLPFSRDFMSTHLKQDAQKELEEAEKGS